MSRRTKLGWIIAGAALVAGVLFLLARPMCACTPALNPVPTPPSVSAALDTLAVRQEQYYVGHGRYSDALSQLGLESLFATWDVRVPIANDRGFDLELSLAVDSISCTYTVRRVTDDTSVTRRSRCYRRS